MKPVTLKVGERDERRRVFLGWRCKHASCHRDACFRLKPTAEEVTGHCCTPRPVFRKENRYRKALREVVTGWEEGADVLGPMSRAKKLLEES